MTADGKRAAHSAEDLLLSRIEDNIKQAVRDRFTGRLTMVFNLSQGGIGQASLNKEETIDLKK